MPQITRILPLSGPVLCAVLALGLTSGTAAAQAGPVITDAVNPKNDTEPDRVNAIFFYGNTKVPTAVLLSGIGVAPGDVMAPAKMGKALDFVVAQYKARGLDVQVRPRVSHPKQNFVNLNFLINEHGTGGHD